MPFPSETRLIDAPPDSSRPVIPDALRRVLADRPPRRSEIERCELCGVDIPAEHGHVVNLQARALLCACRACYLLFMTKGAAGGRFLSVPERYLSLPGGILHAFGWDTLQIPVGVACLFRNSTLGRMLAVYPSPAGATEATLRDEAAPAIAAAHPALATMADDVEALLVRRQERSTECFIVPIDACYELVGRLRLEWRGFQGGDRAWEAIDGFFARVRERSRPADAEVMT